MAFQKGQSGNPGGRPKQSQEFKEAAQSLSTEALERLAYWMRQCEDASASVKASMTIIERGHGKPMQAVEHSGVDGSAIQIEEVAPNEAARLVAFTLMRGTQESKPH